MQLNRAKVESMDIHMLMSLVNMKLRNNFDSLTDLCTSYDLDEQALHDRLRTADYTYDLISKQFR